MGMWPCGCHNSCAGESAQAYRRYNRFSTSSSGHRRRVASGAPVAQQATSIWSTPLSSRVVAQQLVVAAINTPHEDGQRQPLAHVRSAGRAPPMASYTTTDLREEINRQRGGEDSRTVIERHRERRRDIEGRNLEKDFNLHALVCGGLVVHAPLPLTPREFRGGVHGACPTPAYHGLSAQVPAPPTREVRRDGQPCRVLVDLPNLHPRCRRERGHHGQLLPCSLD
jgi:hypothetical protein